MTALSKLSPIFCYEPAEIKPERYGALTFKISFETAQFRKHIVKLYRDTYLMPLPSTVAGIVGAMLGVDRSQLRDFTCEKELMTGSMLLSYEGTVSETMTVIKMKEWKREIIRTPKRNVMLFRPSYKLAVASSDRKLIGELKRRIEHLDFEFDPFGGNDYNFVSHVGEVREAALSLADSGYGCSKLSEVIGVEGDGLIHLDDVNDGVITKYAFSYGAKLLVRRSLVVQDEEHSIFVHSSWKFLR